ncbi:hypothetical protein RB195_013170 [Necator americanus]|uniref:Zinc finger protein-like 1 homolog n=1 Tax=Necator americanus TaxID=51031 RepID=A0ABR1DUZ3_NECAM
MYRKSWGKTPQPMEKKKEKQTETRQSNVHSSIDVIGEARPKTNPLLVRCIIDNNQHSLAEVGHVSSTEKAMGLCKCPRKKVTNLFCFEHRVNVCEHCLVENHRGCVVQSYLQWLTDCDYDTNCSLCERPLADAETIRLQCLHLLHWSCLDEWARRFPATTAPAGYCCPFCREALFPAMNQTSPMIDELRTKLQQANWARAGLGLPLLPELEPTSLPPQQAHRPTSNSTSGPPHFNVVNNDGHFPVQSHANRSGTATPEVALEIDDAAFSGKREQVTFTSRKKHAGGAEPDTQPLLSRTSERDADSEHNKYKRRPAREWLRGIWRAKYGSSTPDHFTGYKRVLIIALFLFLLLVTVIVVLTKAGIGAAEDPLLDPMNNPNIRVAVEGGVADSI